MSINFIAKVSYQHNSNVKELLIIYYLIINH